MGSDFKALIFDFDGTLYDFSLMPLRLILHEPLHVHRIYADRIVRRQLKGMDFGSSEAFIREYNRRMSERTRMSEEECSLWYQDKYIKTTMLGVLEHSYKIRDGLKSFIASLHQKQIHMAVFSDYPYVSERMLAVGMDGEMTDWFSRICSAQDFGCLKPASRAFVEIADSLGVPPESCLVVGDRNDTDGAGAKNSGMGFIQIAPKNKEEQNAAHPVMTWQGFTQWAAKEFSL